MCHWITMEYAVSRMKMLRVWDSAISVPVGLLGFNQGNVNFLVSTPTPCFFFSLVLEFLFRRRVTCQLSKEKKKSGTWIEICQGNYNKMSAMNINFLGECHSAVFVFTSNTCLESVWCAFEMRLVFRVLHASHSMVSKLARPTLLSHFISSSRSSVPHFWHPSWSWWTISLNSTIRRPSTIQSSLSSGSVKLLKGIKLLKLAAFLVNFPSLVRNIFYFFYGQSQIGSAPKSSWRQKKKRSFSAPCTRFTFASRLRPAKKHTRYIACSRVLAELFSVCSALWHRCW